MSVIFILAVVVLVTVTRGQVELEDNIPIDLIPDKQFQQTATLGINILPVTSVDPSATLITPSEDKLDLIENDYETLQLEIDPDVEKVTVPSVFDSVQDGSEEPQGEQIVINFMDDQMEQEQQLTKYVPESTDSHQVDAVLGDRSLSIEAGESVINSFKVPAEITPANIVLDDTQ